MGKPKTKKTPVVGQPAKKKPVISVITTFYNAEQFILKTLVSIDMQKTDDKFTIEYVIVDDKSPDGTRKVVEAFIEKAAKNKDVTYRVLDPDQNLGCGGARKFGIEHATGDYYMFVDADDYYLNSDFMLRAYTTLITEGADIVEYGIIYNQTSGKKTNSCASQKIVTTNSTAACLHLFRDNLIKFNVWSKIYTREIVMSYPYSDSRTFEDVRTIPIWVSHAKKVVIMPSCEINYRAVTGSIIRTDNTDTRLGTISAIVSLLPAFKDDKQVLKAMYSRSMVDLEAMLHNGSSNNKGFNEMSRLNTEMLKYLYPDTYKSMTFHIEDYLAEQEAAKNTGQEES